jgi:UDPglucose 6-dehydrogenase
VGTNRPKSPVPELPLLEPELERIAIVGIGKIGLCLALNFDRAGFQVLGIDRDRDRVRRIAARTLASSEPEVEQALAAARGLEAADDLGAIRVFSPGLVFIAVDTPTARPGGYDHGCVDRVLEDLFALGERDDRTELVVTSTTLPGYCDSKAESALAHGYALSYNPVFVAQGSIMHDQQNPDQVLIGEADAVAGDKLVRLHRRMCLNQPAFHRMRRLSAEISKLATNCFLTNKIAFANAIGDLALNVGAEPEKILDAVGADARIGPSCLRYGYGYGGPCFPRDNRALTYFAEQNGFALLQAEATDEMNRRHLDFQVNQCLLHYPENEPIHIRCVTYKPGTELLDESQPLELARRLAKAGRRVVVHEQAALLQRVRQEFGDLFEYRSLSPLEERSPAPSLEIITSDV